MHAPIICAPTCTPDARSPGIVPNRRPPRPQQPIFSMFRRGGLRFGHIIPRSRSPRWGKWRHENTDMPKERSSCCKTPALLMRERSEHHNENSTFFEHVLSVLIVGYPPSTPTFPYQHAENSPASNTSCPTLPGSGWVRGLSVPCVPLLVKGLLTYYQKNQGALDRLHAADAADAADDALKGLAGIAAQNSE